MSIRINLKRMVEEAVNNFDFEDLIIEAIQEIDITEMIEEKVGERIREFDFSDMIQEYVETMIDEAIDDAFDDFEADMANIIADTAEDLFNK